MVARQTWITAYSPLVIWGLLDSAVDVLAGIHHDNLQCGVNHCSPDYRLDCCVLNAAHESLLDCGRNLGCTGHLLSTPIYTMKARSTAHGAALVVKTHSCVTGQLIKLDPDVPDAHWCLPADNASLHDISHTLLVTKDMLTLDFAHRKLESDPGCLNPRPSSVQLCPFLTFWRFPNWLWLKTVFHTEWQFFGWMVGFVTFSTL